MGFTEAVRTVLTKKYATFSGRASRSEYWWFQLFYVLIAIILAILAALSGAFSINQDESSPLIFIFGAIGGLLALAIVSLQVRRFHDRNMSGWWYLAVIILSMVPFIGRATGIALAVLSTMKGTEGPNKFGPDPLRPDARAEVFA
ncbi:DUF805 domain-containing protein [Rhizobium pisi]|uniref:DUF805 domain-containing protein n=1 Tax=Rhizobium TaxID=379 RepID=UPI00103A1F8F|nr:DUF805 domain-containing protein [Rhizobium pisi]TCA59497.1 DUF805 domain-containing protein [Rhizobium pisi]